MIGAGLLAKKAVEKGLRVALCQDELAPGPRRDRLPGQSRPDRAARPLGFHTVGYGCTTCIGNSGPLPEPVANAINEGDLVASAVLSGNRNFEGRVNPLTKANYLASPPLVVAYALAGTMDIDLINEPLGHTTPTANDVLPERHLAQPRRNPIGHRNRFAAKCSKSNTANAFDSNEKWNAIEVASRRFVRVGIRQHLHSGAAIPGRH